MKQLILILLLVVTCFSSAQTTAIPDPNFEQVLINYGWDGVIDGQVLTANIDTVTNLNARISNISSLSGIEDFTALVNLSCDSNSLSSLNVTQNTALWYLGCYDNPLTSLDVTQNPDLTIFYCSNTLLTSLDVTQNLALWSLYCYSTPLTSLDLSQNVALYELACYDNSQLNCLNLKSGANIVINYIYALNNPNLTCIEVDNVAYSTTNWTNIDAGASFSTNCNNACSTVGIDELYIPIDVNIYPNPTTKNITISSNDVLINPIVTINNYLGQEVLLKKYTTTDYIGIDLDVPSGIYFLTIQSRDKIITKKILKQ